ncbi:bifunctional 3,4-dihydroxy-2-butanone-4-phosphate synthase/GTP cyclohydrolase II [Companilactobacillus alimentarius]|uniref:GTP cyclohydrolase-2 n=1 Tax=Companilactobacillus alimentarius DSM 20249 TaxID=1423720 RepID=A0A2K9HES2_9LACO|nr:bifunctional 3,4-dihydroxy-2-butanone-4-phosphate synthase/GTP cyclohydrolase II [Companilactobacillus alimentarius]AUI71064.1 bifunctional 3,4-dihydroxy-2-butanone 4-phosphate synthase/GTP cyclohydrolase II [Companilactobacillus alimentarius DSM 20249]KRK75182.1 GTP cyclohydrolase II [Companilactobacillus alimentarius DSM 20249]MDT6951680.1 bifunctional 3,4-dihydroxy-2-butanone-4-phosphate synthase/GTP cyclohydrolase II [Companilactobacillus alimentarius]GEO44041.1 GTP cyclohydrolase-2 [Com
MSNNQSILKVEQALKDLQQGKLIIVADSTEREAEGDMIGLADFVSPENVNYMIQNARGLLCVPMSSAVARKLDLNLMSQSHDAFHTAFTISTDSKMTTTGISAFDRAKTIKALADSNNPKDFYHPGHIFPLIAADDGVLERDGHTEAAVDLARLTHATPVAYICEVVKDNGKMARRADLKAFAQKENLTLITIEDIINYRFEKDSTVLKSVSDVDLPTKFGHFRLKTLTFKDEPILVIYKGKIENQEDLLVRIHSECFTGDILGSKRCDCGQQLEQSLIKIEKNGSGMLIYLHQEGRGIGLINKLKAYQLQDQGLDTVEANLKLDLPADKRDYRMVVAILKRLKVGSIELLTNNPDKVKQLENLGIKVKRVALEMKPNSSDQKYLETKKHKFHHLLNEVD